MTISATHVPLFSVYLNDNRICDVSFKIVCSSELFIIYWGPVSLLQLFLPVIRTFYPAKKQNKTKHVVCKSCSMVCYVLFAKCCFFLLLLLLSFFMSKLPCLSVATHWHFKQNLVLKMPVQNLSQLISRNIFLCLYAPQNKTMSRNSIFKCNIWTFSYSVHYFGLKI